MNENLQNQIDALNQKMDTVLDYIQTQQMRNMTTDDLMSDLAIIGKDVYDSSVEALDKQQIEINPDQVRDLVLKFARNIGTFNDLMDSMESVSDLLKDASPLITEAIIDFSKQLNKLNEKGIFENLKYLLQTAENLISAGDPNKIEKIGRNADLIAEIFTHLADRQVLLQINKLVKALADTQKKEIKPKSPVKLVLSKEMKQTSGFILAFLEQLNDNNNRDIN